MRFGLARWERRAESAREALLGQHDVAATLRSLADAFAAMDDLAGSMALHAAANGFEQGVSVPGVGFVIPGTARIIAADVLPEPGGLPAAERQPEPQL